MRVCKTRYCSYKIGNLPKGCRLCVKGAKLVLFVTGICSSGCGFCPISDQKYNKDVVYADEWPVKKKEDILREAEMISALGAGITGGDPLARIDRAAGYIKMLKKRFGGSFHIHLYAPLGLVNDSRLNKLFKAGLDEIRLHPSLESERLYSRIRLAQKYKWDVGVEIPVIPGRKAEIKRLVDFLCSIKIGFLNLNELEVSDNSHSCLLEKGFKAKDNMSYAVKGSEDLAFEILDYCRGKIKDVHYCTAFLKDNVQLANRIKRRAKNAAMAFDIITKEGNLMRGALYLNEIRPGFGYNSALEKINSDAGKRKRIALRLRKALAMIKKDFGIDKRMICIDWPRLRIITGVECAAEIKKRHESDREKYHYLDGFSFAAVSEFPTYDSMITELEFI